MTDADKLTVADRIELLMNQLGIEKAHFAGRSGDDWSGSALNYPERIASLSLIGLSGYEQEALEILAARTQIVFGDSGGYVEAVNEVKDGFQGVSFITLSDYQMIGWSDVIADRRHEVGRTILQFLGQHRSSATRPLSHQGPLDGEVAGIYYQIRGSGPPLVLLPLTFAPSQWNPIITMLAEQYCTITLGGVHLGMMPALEQRGNAKGYQRIVKNLLREAPLQPGQSILDVGPGSGVLDRWLVHETAKENPITAVEINAYLMGEATRLADNEGLLDTIEFQEGDATSLTFPENTFDLSLSVTVLEEGDADKMLAEMVRVTKPGGTVAAIVRAMDLPFIVNLDVQSKTKEKLNNLRYGHMSERGCADRTLYQRFRRAGLTQVTDLPQLATFGQGDSVLTGLSGLILSSLNSKEQTEVRNAISQAEAVGAYFISWPHHCAIGTKPN